MAVNVRVLFFGATAGVTGERAIDLSLPDHARSQAAFDQLLTRFPNLTKHKLLFSLNQNYATGNEVMNDGDELAIFTAVSGG
jgi:molybdopterin converting factor small subunit